MQRGPNRPRNPGGIIVAAVVVLALAGTASAAPQPDAWVTTKVKMALLTSEGVSGTAAKVAVSNGVTRVIDDLRLETPAVSAR